MIKADFSALDAKWFARRPHRKCRIRLAEIAEIEALMRYAAALGISSEVNNPRCLPVYSMIFQITPGVRQRILFWSEQDFTNLPDNKIIKIYHTLQLTAERNKAGRALH